MRAFLGFVAAAIAVLTFHQGMVAALYEIGWAPFAPFRTTPVPPFGVPVIVSLCFWGGLYGAVFGLLMPRFTWPLWLCGLILGVIAALVGMFIVAPIKGNPIAGGWVPANHAALVRDQRLLGFRRRPDPADADAAITGAGASLMGIAALNPSYTRRRHRRMG